MLRYALGATMLLLMSCCPVQQNTRPAVAVLNAPSENRVTGLADEFVAGLVKQAEAASFRLSGQSALRYQETHRDISGSRAPLQAAFAARSQGAQYAVMLGFDAKKTVTDAEIVNDRLELSLKVSGQLRATIVSAQGADVLGTFSSAPFTKRQLEIYPFSEDPATPEGKAKLERLTAEALDDPLSAFSGANFEDALADLAQPVASELARLVTASTQPR